MTNNISGKTITYKDFFNNDAVQTQKLVDFYEGSQLNYVCQMLDGAVGGFGKRTEWRHRGIIPRVRNVTKSIVEKSGLLFNKPPKLGIVTPGATDPVTDPTLQELLDNADWVETMQNVDVYTRLCGSVVLLQQLIVPQGVYTKNGQYTFDYTRDQLTISILHQGNTVVRMNQAKTKIIELAYLTDTIEVNFAKGKPKQWSYCVWTLNGMYDVIVDEGEQPIGGTVSIDDVETVSKIGENLYFDDKNNPVIPASFNYDTRKPRSTIWTRPAEDLVSLQEMVNLALTDTEHAVAFQKQKMLIITGDMMTDDNNQGDLVVPAATMGHNAPGQIYNDIPFYQTRKQTSLGGLGSVVKLGTDGAGAAGKAEYVGPDTALLELEQIITQYVNAVANDWCVNLNYGGKGSASSGFQLIVEEIDNLQLRDQRAQMMQAGLRRMYEITKCLLPGQLTDGYLMAEFAPPNLPVNQTEQEDLWTQRIDNNRATIKDYLMEVNGLSDVDADAKMQDILKQNALMGVAQPAPAQPVADPEVPGKPATNGIPDA